MYIFEKFRIIFFTTLLSLLLPFISQAKGAAPSMILNTGSGSSSATIYANGNMQAKINVIIKHIPDGYRLDQVELKEAYTSSELPNFWNKSSIDNGYDHNVESTYIPRSHSSTTSNDITTEVFYLSTHESGADITLCVEAHFSSTSSEEPASLSTCNGDANKGLVHLTVLPEEYHSFEHLKLTTAEEYIFENGYYAIITNRFTLKGNREIKYVGGCDTSYYDDGERYLIASSLSQKDTSSAAYLFNTNQGDELKSSFSYIFGGNYNMTKSFNYNTNKSVTIVQVSGYKLFSTKTNVNPLVNRTILCPEITYRDNFGNEGKIELSRHNPYSDGQGKIYYKFE
ncbi:hypothetical protein [Vibrio genomosp. F10]|uniref:hypothetical protein n=1 Tax=Vibrio genomosp. F10 TaxID=723171 RepID=UPI0002EB3924|nr:hypothetical protein [Vibrio genomosp. F10]OEE94420.1 hypothetical protein A1QK_16500 [Vibrio genomosp. F10 str. 9ZD137]